MKFAKAILICLLLSGCTVRPFENFSKSPLSITTVSSNYFNVMLKFSPIADELGKSLKRSVRVLSDWDVNSIKVHLRSQKDYCQLLYLSPVEFCQINKNVALKVIAIKQNQLGKTSETGFIVVPKNSPIKNVAELKGKRFVFGTYGDAYRFYNVLALFKESNLPTALLKDVSYSEDSVAAVRRILLGWADAGVVTKSWWQTTTDRTLDFSKLLKDELRIIGETKPVPEYVWAVTNSVSDDQRAKIVTVIAKSLSGKPNILAGFKAKGFLPADNKVIEDYCKSLEKIKNLPPKPGILPLK